MKLAVLGLGYFVGKKVYNFVGDSYPSWARLTVAIILGFAVSVAAMGLTLSHKFVRISNEMTPDNSGDG
jgi:predicted MFS family arabinose efflux permease